MKYRVGDKVLVKAEVVEIFKGEDKFPIRLYLPDEDNERCWFKEDDLMLDMTSVDTIPQEEVMKSAYNQGLNDAWELARKIFTFNNNKMEKVFGFVEKRSAFDDLNPQEALAKLKAYEEAQIEVGDVVDWLGVKAVVIDTIDEERIYLFDENGCVEEVQKYNCEKLGKQLDIKGFIEQIGE